MRLTADITGPTAQRLGPSPAKRGDVDGPVRRDNVNERPIRWNESGSGKGSGVAQEETKGRAVEVERDGKSGANRMEES